MGLRVAGPARPWPQPVRAFTRLSEIKPRHAGRGILPTLDEDLQTGDIAAARAKLQRLKDLLRGQVAALVVVDR